MGFTYREPSQTCPKLDTIVRDIEKEINDGIDKAREINYDLRDEFKSIIDDCIGYYEDTIQGLEDKIDNLEKSLGRYE